MSGDAKLSKEQRLEKKSMLFALVKNEVLELDVEIVAYFSLGTNGYILFFIFCVPSLTVINKVQDIFC